MLSTNLEDGSQDSWQDSLVVFGEDDRGHVFHSTFTPSYDTPYEIEITRSDGAVSRAITKTPTEVISDFEVVKDTGTDIATRFFWTMAPRLQNVIARYNLLIDLQGEVVLLDYSIPYEVIETTSASDWEITLQFDDNAREVFRTLNRPQGSRLTLCDVDVEALVTNREWYPPDGNYDPDLLVQPNVFTNVENGFGFVGSGYSHSQKWLPDSTQIVGAGFHYDRRCY